MVIWIINHFFSGTHLFHLKRALLQMIGVRVGERSKIVGPIMFDDNSLEIGEDCWVGKNFSVYGNGKVIIGNNCDIAPDVVIETGSHKIGDKSRRAGPGYNNDIIIEDGCWLGLRCSILPGVIIKAGCIVAAGAVVTSTFDENCILGGVPAKIIKSI